MVNAPLARFPARMDSMAEIRAFVEDACTTAGIGREDCLKLLLIVEELVTNTVPPGYREESESPAWIALDPCDPGLSLRYEDAAPPHTPCRAYRAMGTA